MTINGWLQIAIYFVVLIAITSFRSAATWPACSKGERTFLSPVLRPVEAALYRVAGVDEKREQNWLTYTVGMLLFQCRRLSILLWADAPAGDAAVQSSRTVGSASRILPSTRRQLHRPTPIGRTTAVRAR